MDILNHKIRHSTHTAEADSPCFARPTSAVDGRLPRELPPAACFPANINLSCACLPQYVSLQCNAHMVLCPHCNRYHSMVVVCLSLVMVVFCCQHNIDRDDIWYQFPMWSLAVLKASLKQVIITQTNNQTFRKWEVHRRWNKSSSESQHIIRNICIRWNRTGYSLIPIRNQTSN